MKSLFILSLTLFLLLEVKFAIKFERFTDNYAISNVARAAERDIWTQMREDTGYVVLLRHAQTVSGTGDPPGFELDDCTTQRNLSQAGREQAKQIGKEFRDRNITIEQVLSSQYCRCLDTARLLDLGTVKPSPMLNSIFEDRTTVTQQVEQTRQRIFDRRQSLGVTVMVTHFANITEISGVSPQEGEAVVIKSDQQGNLEVIGTIQDW
ncbi:histidine phosphatase family protein [Myxosarcina sp. GI1]|uniref:histidine phosphatase family protein n=1 Tax=Myxosarcina sp. GI1 TaxID=1541065 RepID=UPI00068FD578|nr:histidine phosphatase family protein [Myxosarcina sp. GI1]